MPARRALTTRFNRLDRVFWVGLSMVWHRWSQAMRLVQPDTVVHWDRQGWRLFWRWKSGAWKVGRHSVAAETIDRIRQMCQAHRRRVLQSDLAYYHGCRTHFSLDKDAPEPRRVQPPEEGKISAFPEVGGIHHRYKRRVA